MSKPKIFGERYEVIEELGEGGNATVYLVKDIITGKEYALKPFTRPKDKEKMERFKREISVVNEYKDKITGILPIEDYMIDDDKKEYWYVMPKAKEINEELLDRENDYMFIINGIIELSDTLSKLHEQGHSHRDIKPENIYYFNNRFNIGDFGLVSFLDSEETLTKPRALGAYSTMAPEMRRDPQLHDGQKADVYSLAKTLWIMLTGKNKGFDGVYDFRDKTIGLRYISLISKIHIVELEEFLRAATDNDPDKRPTMKEFNGMLKQWLSMEPDNIHSHQVQYSEWRFINKLLFGENSLYTPDTVSWEDNDRIRDVLSLIATLPAFNHMFYVKGGLDFVGVEKASEPKCLYLYEDCATNVIKPKRLIYCNFPQDTRWNYFLFELDELEPILSDYKSNDHPYEFLVEDTPGNYVSAKYEMYGVYDYDTGEKFPEGWKSVRRCYRGKFLICLKYGPYNSIGATYDGRHSQCTSDCFRRYIMELVNLSDMCKQSGIDEDVILNSSEISKNPFTIPKEEKIKEVQKQKIKDGDKPKTFVQNNLDKWCFSDIMVTMPLITDAENEYYAKMSIIYDKNRFEFRLGAEKSKKMVMCKDFYFKSNPDPNDILYFYSIDEALSAENSVRQQLLNICKDAGYILEMYETFIDIDQTFLDYSPSWLFSKEEISTLMRNADDRKNNILVINYDGHAEIIQDIEKSHYYPVSHESWNSGNNYVGKYSTLSSLDDDYVSSLQGWLLYLKTRKHIRMDYVHDNRDVNKLIMEISQYYN